MKSNIETNKLSNITPLGRVRLLAFLAVSALIYSLISVFLLNTSLMKDWENRFQAQYYLWKTHFKEPEASSLPMVIVLIDDHSLPVNSARSPIDRAWLADLLYAVSHRNPTIVALNILLDRPGTKLEDQKLIEAISQAGNVILRTDPFYPVYPGFAEAALDKGTVKFRLDSSDTVQEVCNNQSTCQSPHIFHEKILDYYQFANGLRINGIPPESSWSKINFSLGSRERESFTIKTYPVIRAHELPLLPEGAFEGKIVLIGTGFPDLYPLYRVPLAEPVLMLQETEIVAQVLNMVSGNNYLRTPADVFIGSTMCLIMLIIALLLVYRGVISGMVGYVVTIICLFLFAAWMFAFKNIEIPFILPASVILFFTVTGVLTCGVQEKLFRLTAELNLKQSKIDFLTNELHSHHLFNEFSRLSVMIQHDPKSAKEYLVEFAEMLRSSLKYGDQAMVPVAVQLEYLESYLKQQQMIHREKMVFRFNKSEDVASCLAPWHAFFPLVENAVKHVEGLLKQTGNDKAEVVLDLSILDNKLVFSVNNPYNPSIQTVSSKTGLKNLRDRLVLAYPEGGFDLDFIHDDHKWKAELRLPIQQGKL